MCVWTEDADTIKWDDKQFKMVYMNHRIKEFLKNNRKLGIAATKGQGKTFLIKAKRVQYQNASMILEDNNITCFPINDMVDTLDASVTVNRSLEKLLSNYYEWVTLWKLSVAITIIASTEFEYLYKDDKSILSVETKALMEVYNEKRRPSIILTHLLEMDYYRYRYIRDDASTIIRLLDKIPSGIYIFIDKVDQAFSDKIYLDSFNSKSRNASYWQYCQYALANAAYELMSNINVHIKVFYSIRHEALIDSEQLAKNTARNIEAFLVELIYKKEDLQEMFKLYVRNEDDNNLHSPEYKEKNEEKAFFGFETLEHRYVENVNEKVFDYLYRHSLRRPYDIMKICKELYLNGPKELTKDTVRRVINETSGEVLKKYFSEVEPFITCDYKDIEKLLTCINTNIFSLNYIQYICKRYNEEYEMKNICNKDCNNCKNIHPFSTLYNIGILGYLQRTSFSPVPRQCFLPIGESKLKLSEYDLPSSDLYVLHPCLCDEARRLREQKNKKFFTINDVIVGEDIQISDEIISKIKKGKRKFLNQLDKEKVFISSPVNCLQEERKKVKEIIYNKGYYPIMSEEDNFAYGPNNIHSHDFCIDELLKCRQLICIIGKKYGGLYVGNKYEQYIQCIEEKSNNKITKPSISFMEFYVGMIKKRKYRIFIKKEVIDEYQIYKRDKEAYNGDVDKDVFIFIDFINHIEKDGKRAGNWYMTFDSTDRLIKQIRGIDFLK